MRAPPTSANVMIIAANNTTMQDAIQFDGPPGITGITGGTGPYWTFDNKEFRLDIKGNREVDTPLLSLTSEAGEIVVDSTTLRVLHFNVSEATLQAALPPGKYVYDFIMIDKTVTPNVRIPLMHGEFVLTNGVTGG